MTIDQINILTQNLYKIKKAENGIDDKDKPINDKEDKEAKNNTTALFATAENLKQKTGRTRFSYQELANPSETLRKHNEMKLKGKNV